MSRLALQLSPALRCIVTVFVAGLALCLALRLLLWLTYPDYFATLTLGEALRAQLTGMRFDLAIITQINALTLLALLLPLRIANDRRWLRFWMILAGFSLATILVLGVVSIGFFGEVQRHLGAELLFMMDDWPLVFDLLKTSRRSEFIALTLVLLASGWAWWRLTKIAADRGRSSGRVMAWFMFALALPVLVILARGLELDGKTINVVDAYALGDARLGNLAMNAAFSVVHTTRNLQETLQSPISDNEEQALREQLGITQANPFLRHYVDRPAQSPNIVLIILESWSNEYIHGLSGNHLGVTPNMDKLLQESLVYDNHYAAAQRSIQSIQAILTGVPVLPGQPRLSEGLEQVNMSRIGHLAAGRDYRSVFVQSSTRRSFRMDSVAASLGFTDYYGQEDIPLVRAYPQPTPRFGWDHDTLQFFHKKVDRLATQGPVLGVVFTGTTHEPFADPGEQFHRYPHDSKSENGYLNTLAYSDWALGEFMAQARSSEWYDNTIFVITSDHVLRASAESLRSRFRVPLIIHAPGRIAPGRSHKLVSQYDILPTLVDLMDSEERFVAFGESVFRNDHPDEAWVSQGETVGLIRRDRDLTFLPSDLTNMPAAGAQPQDRSLRQRATLLTHLVLEKINSNRWMLGTEP